MQFRIRTLFILIGGCAISLAFVSLVGPRGLLMGFDGKRQHLFNEIQIGNRKQHAVELLGKSRGTTTELLNSITYLDPESTLAKIAKCSEFIWWRNGGNWFYCIGVDDNGMIVLKAEGHS